MTTETYKKSVPLCVSVSRYRTESVPRLSQTCIDELGRLVIVVELDDIGEAGAIFAPHSLSWTDPELALFPLGAPEIFTRAEAAESVTSSFLSPPTETMWSTSSKSSLKCNRYRAITGDSGTGLQEIFLRLLGKARSFAPKDFALRSSPEEIVEQAREPHQEALEWIKRATGLSWEDVGDLLGVSHPTVLAWKQGKSVTRRSHRQRLFAVRDVLERAMKRNPSTSELAAWLDTPRGSDAKTPAELLGAGKIGKARLLAITTPSPKVKSPPDWARRNLPEAYASSRERQEVVPPSRDEELLELLDEDEEE